ncbi:AraC family transcriptional regulator [Curtobacterium sp. RRHDQ10]|uniref:helix-turn-helix transcriptional regulator n=1 Tax=Curtobacterium phyllosphaerae TaxID=3413379 RepID=UPI003BF353D2
MSSEHDPRERFEAAGSDADDAVALFAAEYRGSGFRVRETGAFSYRHTMIGGGGMQLRGSRFGAAIEGEIEPDVDYVVNWLTRGSGVLDIGRDEVRMRVGRPHMFPTGRPYGFALADVEQNLVHFERRFLEELAAERAGTEPGPLWFDHQATPDGDALVRWREAVSVAARTLAGRDAPTPVLLTEVSLATARTLLATFPHRVLAPATPAGGRTGRVGAAVEYMHANADRGITTTDVARAVGLSVRGLQQAFQRQLGEAPNAVLRGIRLDRTREDLRRSGPSDTTVAAIARRWGFGHLGRFSASYAARFGEFPRDTLHR